MQRIFVGTYTSQGSLGIYSTALDGESGSLTEPVLAAESPNPTFLAVHPLQPVLYAVGEKREGNRRVGSVVRAFEASAETGCLRLLNDQPSQGVGPCHVSVHPCGTHLFAAHYAGGSVSVFPLERRGHILPASSVVQHEAFSAVHPGRQEAAHAHSMYAAGPHDLVLVADLGADAIYAYRLDKRTGTLRPSEPPRFATVPGSGPRHLAFLEQDGRTLVYAIHELDGTIAVHQLDDNGKLSRLQIVSMLPDDYHGENTTAEVAVHPSGRFLYGSNRGHDSIAVFAIDVDSGMLTPVQRIGSGGEHPRHFALDATGRYLVAANRDTDNLVVFDVDPESGRLSPTGKQVAVSKPVCVRFLR